MQRYLSNNDSHLAEASNTSLDGVGRSTSSDDTESRSSQTQYHQYQRSSSDGRTRYASYTSENAAIPKPTPQSNARLPLRSRSDQLSSRRNSETSVCSESSTLTARTDSTDAYQYSPRSLVPSVRANATSEVRRNVSTERRQSNYGTETEISDTEQSAPVTPVVPRVPPRRSEIGRQSSHHGLDLLGYQPHGFPSHQRDDQAQVFGEDAEVVSLTLPHCQELELLECGFARRLRNQAQNCQLVKLTVVDPNSESCFCCSFKLPLNGQLQTLRRALWAQFSNTESTQSLSLTIEYISYDIPHRSLEQGSNDDLPSETVLVHLPECLELKMLHLATCGRSQSLTLQRNCVRISSFFPMTNETLPSIKYKIPSGLLRTLENALKYTYEKNGARDTIAELKVQYS